MKQLRWIAVFLLYILFSCFRPDDGLNPGLYEFTYVSTYGTGNKPTEGSWRKPHHLNHGDQVAYKVISDKLIYKGYNGENGIYKWQDTLMKVPKAQLSKFKPVQASILDFKLVGVYYPDRRFSDTFTVIYYSKKRNSILEQLHVYTLPRLEFMAIYMNTAHHPFYNIEKYFKMRDIKDSIYQAPKQKLEFH
ncbi:hypothetical protein [uncultured Pedobacter sp.]|uniref:hypothetical protein n=1 Tax=uncultured Pedobacter sp. TaxID=246139 RepID=UPI0025F7FFD0|nr:hypothetical protein [uncultured Pedobacter sp.]